DEQAWLEQARRSDRAHLAGTFLPRDPQDLHGEVNVLRHLPVPAVVRAAAGTRAVALERVLHAAATVGADVEVSVADPGLREVAGRAAPVGTEVLVEDAAAFAARVPELSRTRIRLLGGADEALLAAIAARVEVALYDAAPTVSGRVELRAFLREQVVSATDHRYGNPLLQEYDLTGGMGYSRGR